MFTPLKACPMKYEGNLIGAEAVLGVVYFIEASKKMHKAQLSANLYRKFNWELSAICYELFATSQPPHFFLTSAKIQKKTWPLCQSCLSQRGSIARKKVVFSHEMAGKLSTFHTCPHSIYEVLRGEFPRPVRLRINNNARAQRHESLIG
jgi:hypothetical protein